MSGTVEFGSNKASEAQIAEHLSHCDADFVPPLSSRVVISDYAKKIVANAIRFEAWSNGDLVGLAAMYCNDREKRVAYITSVSVLREWMGKGIATNLMRRCVEHAKEAEMERISLEVSSGNPAAIRLYEKCGFSAGKASAPFLTMDLYLRQKRGRE